jgi:hypothetical protein
MAISDELAQDARGMRLAAQSLNEFLRCLAARSRALCALECGKSLTALRHLTVGGQLPPLISAAKAAGRCFQVNRLNK